MSIDLTGRLAAALRALDDAVASGDGIDAARGSARDALATAASAKGPWMAIDDDARSGEDVLLYFPLEGLADHNPRIVIGRWRRDAAQPAGGHWVFQNRAVRGYSDGFQPTHWQPLLPPDA